MTDQEDLNNPAPFLLVSPPCVSLSNKAWSFVLADEMNPRCLMIRVARQLGECSLIQSFRILLRLSYMWPESPVFVTDLQIS